MAENNKNLNKGAGKPNNGNKGNTVKGKALHKNKLVSEDFLKYFRIVLLVCLAAVVFYPPFLRGLYFEAEQFPTEIFIFIVFSAFWVYKIIKRDGAFLKTPLDYASFGFVIVYLITMFVAVGLRYAVSEWLKYYMYFAVFFMLSELLDTYRSKLAVLWTITASSAGVALLGIDGMAGNRIADWLNNLLRILGAPRGVFFGLYGDGRITSTIQYANALAIYLIAGFFITLGLMTASSKLWTKFIAGAVNFVLLTTFVFTLSRGVYLLMPVSAVIFLLTLPKGSRIRGAVYAFPALIPAAFASFRFSSYMPNLQENGSSIWSTVLIGIVMSFVITIVVSYILKWLEKLSWKVYVGAVVVAAIVLLLSTLYMLNSHTPLELSHSSTQEDSNISVKKSVVLKPGGDYRLEYDVTASIEGDKPEAYSISIANRTIKDIISNIESPIVYSPGKPTKDVESKTVEFKVPEESSIVNIYFSNNYAGTKALFDNARVVDVQTGKIVKELVLKYKYLPDTITERFEDIQATRSSIERGIFYKDGLNILKDYWVLGAGGGAWQLLYFSYQSYLYTTTQAHNFFLQVAIEAGIPGLLMAILLIASVFLVFMMNYKAAKSQEDPRKGIIQSAVLTAILALLMHSAIDFDLSISALALLLWELAAVLNAGCRYSTAVEGVQEGNSFVAAVLRKVQNIKGVKIFPAVGLLVTVIVLAIPISLISAVGYANAAAAAQNNNNTPLAIKNMKNAILADTYNPLYRIQYASLLRTQENSSQKDLIEADNHAARAEKLARFGFTNSDTANRISVIPLMAQYYFTAGNMEKGLYYVDLETKLRPFIPSGWQRKVDAYMQIALQKFNNKENKLGMDYIDKTLGIIDEVKAVNGKNLLPFILNANTQEMLERVKFVKDVVGTTNAIELDKVVFYSLPDMDVDANGVPDQWAESDTAKVKISTGENGMTVESLVPDNGAYIQSRAINFIPGKTYTIEVELDKSEGIENIPFVVTGVSGENEGIKPESGVYRGEIQIPADLKVENNALQLSINGKFEIKAVRILEK